MTVRGVVEWWRESGRLDRTTRLLNKGDAASISEVRTWTLNRYKQLVRLRRDRGIVFCVAYSVFLLVSIAMGSREGSNTPTAIYVYAVFYYTMWPGWKTPMGTHPLAFVEADWALDRLESVAKPGFDDFNRWLDKVEAIIGRGDPFVLKAKTETAMARYLMKTHRPGQDILEWGRAPTSRIARFLGAYGNLPQTKAALEQLAAPDVYARMRPGLYQIYVDALAAFDARHVADSGK